MEEVAVVGAGPGGLAFALALARRGRPAVIFEKTSIDSRLGAGIQITPNGSAVLNALGLGDRLHECCVPADELEIWDYRGKSKLAAFPFKPAAGDWPGPYWLASRRDLLSALTAEALDRGVEIQHGRLVRDIEINSNGALCRFSDGSSREFGLVVGADGINSVVWKAIGGASRAEFSGHVAWRASIPANAGEYGLATGRVRIVLAPRRHVVLYAVQGGEILNVVAVEERRLWEGESLRRKGDIEAFGNAFGDFGQPARKVLENCVSPEEWGLFERPVAPVCWKGRAVAIGDALHPMLPFLGQGVNAAFEDAWVLAFQIAGNKKLEDALEGFRRERLNRVARIVARSKRQALAYHLANPALRLAAHASLRLANTMYPRSLGLTLHWLYGKDVTKPRR